MTLHMSEHKPLPAAQPPSSPDTVNEEISRLAAGNLASLAHLSIARALPDYISLLLSETDNGETDLLLEQIVIGLHEDDQTVQKNSALALSGIVNSLARHGDWQRIDKLLPAITHIISRADQNDRVQGLSIAAVAKLAAHHIRRGQYDAARNVLLLITDPESLPTVKLRHYAEQALNLLASRATLNTLLSSYLSENERADEAGSLLPVFGAKAADFLITPLSISEDKDERLKLLKLIENIGMPAENALRRQLKATPWYVTRNMIKLLGATGSRQCFDDVAHYLDHDNLQVKEEVLTAAGKIGGHDGKTFLLRALHTVPRQLTAKVVSLLGEIPDEGLVVPLADLLDKTSMYRSRLDDELRLTICQALGAIGSVKALPTLKKIRADNRSSGSGTPDALHAEKLLQAADEAIKRIEQGGSRRIRQTGIKKITGSPGAAPVAAREAAVFRTALTGDREKAIRMIVDLIADCVQNRDFQNAERLQQRIYEIDPMALTEIIQSADLIEQARTGVAARGYLDIWRELLDDLSPEEFSAIYHEMENRTFKAEESVISQGQQNDELIFINHGTVKVFTRHQDREIFIKTLSSGEMAGENFFSASIWTVSLTTLTPVRISVLRQSSFVRWRKAFPGLESKLKAFYNRSNDIHDLLNKKNLNRRIFERYQLSRKIQIQMTNNSGKPIGREFNGALTDISTGGLALLISITKQENSRLLLGRKMQITIPVGGREQQLQVKGQVQAVHPSGSQGNTFLIHFEFIENLPRETLQTILG